MLFGKSSEGNSREVGSGLVGARLHVRPAGTAVSSFTCQPGRPCQPRKPNFTTQPTGQDGMLSRSLPFLEMMCKKHKGISYLPKPVSPLCHDPKFHRRLFGATFSESTGSKLLVGMLFPHPLVPKGDHLVSFGHAVDGRVPAL